MVGWGLLVALLVAVLGSAVPAWLIARVRPAEVMRNE
jgi:putative ABC transport system permease protein